MELEEIKSIWEKVKEELLKIVPEPSHIWIISLEPMGFDNNIFSLLSGQLMGIEVLKRNHYKDILTAFKKVTGDDIQFELIFNEELAKKMKERIKKKREESDENKQKKEVLNNLSKIQSNSNLNLRFKFENFVVGESNEFAYKVAKAVAENPSKKFNPLFIYGNSGLGKTHLIQAIGQHIYFNNKENLTVKYTKTEDYINDFIERLGYGDNQRQQMAKFRQKYRNVDILLIDDIQLIESKKATIEEVFSMFDALYNKNKQIVITADRLPKELESLPDRLKTRFEMGITVELLPPDFETRVNILKNLAKSNGVSLPKDLLEYLATNYDKNVRELEGAFNKITAYSNITNEPLSTELANKVFGVQLSKKTIKPEDILRACAKVFSVSETEIKGTSRIAQVATARQTAIYLIKDYTDENYVTIGERFGKKHSTIMYSYEKMKKELKYNAKLEDIVKEIKRILKLK